jgi:hypothetical protein
MMLLQVHVLFGQQSPRQKSTIVLKPFWDGLLKIFFPFVVSSKWMWYQTLVKIFFVFTNFGDVDDFDLRGRLHLDHV